MGFGIVDQIGDMGSATKTRMVIFGPAGNPILAQLNIGQRITTLATTQVDAEMVTVIAALTIVVTAAAAMMTSKISTSRCIANAQVNVQPVMECTTLDLVA